MIGFVLGTGEGRAILSHVNKYTDAEADVAIPLTDLGIDPDVDLKDQYSFTKTTLFKSIKLV